MCRDIRCPCIDCMRLNEMICMHKQFFFSMINLSVRCSILIHKSLCISEDFTIQHFLSMEIHIVHQMRSIQNDWRMRMRWQYVLVIENVRKHMLLHLNLLYKTLYVYSIQAEMLLIDLMEIRLSVRFVSMNKTLLFVSIRHNI